MPKASVKDKNFPNFENCVHSNFLIRANSFFVCITALANVIVLSYMVQPTPGCLHVLNWPTSATLSG